MRPYKGFIYRGQCRSQLPLTFLLAQRRTLLFITQILIILVMLGMGCLGRDIQFGCICCHYWIFQLVLYWNWCMYSSSKISYQISLISVDKVVVVAKGFLNQINFLMLIKQGNLLVSRIFVPSKLAVFAQMNRPEVLLFAADRAIFLVPISFELSF